MWVFVAALNVTPGSDSWLVTVVFCELNFEDVLESETSAEF